MKKFVDGIVKIESIIAVVLLAAMLAILFINTVGRYTGLLSLSWAEEFARYAMIWATMLGCGIAGAKGAHFSADILPLFVPEKGMKFFRILVAILVVFFAIMAVIFGIKIMRWQMAAGQVSASMQIPMWFMYLSIPLGMAIMAITFCYHTYEVMTGKAIDLDEANEAAQAAAELEASEEGKDVEAAKEEAAEAVAEAEEGGEK